MSKGLTAGLILMIAILMLGSGLFPNNSSMWLAAVDMQANLIRAGLVAVLLTVLFTDPPRSKALRALFAVSAVGMLGWLGLQLAWYSTLVLDLMVFLQAAIIFALEALEPRPAKDQYTDDEEEPARIFQRSTAAVSAGQAGAHPETVLETQAESFPSENREAGRGIPISTLASAERFAAGKDRFWLRELYFWMSSITKQVFAAVPARVRRLAIGTGQRYRQGLPLWLRRFRVRPETYLRRYSHRPRTAQNPPYT